MSARKNQSVLWSYFEKDPESGKAFCCVCRDLVSYKSTTNNLKGHLKRKHISLYTSIYPEDETPPPSTSQVQVRESRPDLLPGASTLVDCSSSLPPAPKRQRVLDPYVNKKISTEQKKLIDQDVLDLCIDGFHPFSIVEERSFKKFSRWIPGYKLPCRKTLANSMLQATYSKAEETVKVRVAAEVKSICITTDLWTSRVTESYIAITGHYLTDDCELKTILLGCCQFSGHHTAANIATEMNALVNKWNLNGKVNFAVSDNAANIVKAIKEGLGWKHFGCFAHTLNLIVEDALKACKKQIENVKKVVGHFRKSTVSSERLAKYQVQQNQEPKRLIQDVDTRWNSTYYMVKRVVELEEAIRSTMAFVGRDLPILTDEDWKTYKELCYILRPFEELTTIMSGQKYLTGSFVIVMTRCLKEACCKLSEKEDLEPNTRDVVLLLKCGIEERLKGVEQSGTFSLCTFLDPRFKMQAFSDQNEAQKTKERVRKLVTSIIHENTISDDVPQEVRNGVLDELNPWNIFDSFIGLNTTQGTPMSKAIREVDLYLSDEILPRKNSAGVENCPLEWWKNHKHVYPNLKILFTRHCNIIATSVPCERMFSKTGLIVNQRRTRLTTDKIEKLMFLNVNMDEKRFEGYM